MITDEDLPPNPLRRAYLEGYRQFLRLSGRQQVVNGDFTYRGDTRVTRDGWVESYFAIHFGAEYDLFLDPDTRIGKGGNEVVPISALPELVPAGSERVSLVYVSSNPNDLNWRWLLDQV